MKNTFYCLSMICLLANSISLEAQVCPPEEQLIFQALPNAPRPAYRSPITDPIFETTVIRIGELAVFNIHQSDISPSHEYSKVQLWNRNGSLCKNQIRKDFNSSPCCATPNITNSL